MSSITAARGRARAPWAWMLGVAALAVAVRFAVVQSGGGLRGRIGYDGSVYYTAAAALAHGVLPYRDVLLLHPPGIVLALLPFAALGPVLGDGDAYALARLAWMGLGGLSTALVLHLLRPRGLGAALAGAVLYAVFLPAVTSERTTSLEAVGSVCVLAAIALVVGDASRAALGGRGTVRLLVAGALLGLATSTKIWGVALVVVVVAWTAWHHHGAGGLRRASLVLGGAVAASVVVCLPFFVSAPGTMWRMVVLDQLGRPRVSGSLTVRLADVAGLSGLRGTLPTVQLAAGAVLLLVVLLVLAWRDPLGRLAAGLLVASGAVLLLTPPWSLAYTALCAPAAVLLVGCAVGRLGGGDGPNRQVGRVVAAALSVVVVALACASLPAVDAGSRFPGRSLERVLAPVPGCVTTDDPIALIETGALQRNLDRGCPVVADLSGYSWDLRPLAPEHVSREQDVQWQHLAVQHLASGGASVVVRFRRSPGLSAATRATIDRWPLLGIAGPYEVHRPTSSGSRPPG